MPLGPELEAEGPPLQGLKKEIPILSSYHPHPTLPLVGDPAAFMAGKGEGLARLPLRGTSGQGGGEKWDFLYYKSMRRRKGHGIE